MEKGIQLRSVEYIEKMMNDKRVLVMKENDEVFLMLYFSITDDVEKFARKELGEYLRDYLLNFGGNTLASQLPSSNPYAFLGGNNG